MPNIAITGCSSRFAQVLLPILEADPTIEHIHGLDLVPPATSSAKLTFHRRDIRDADLKDTFAGCDTLIHLAFIVGRPYSMSLQEAASINLAGTWNVCRLARGRCTQACRQQFNRRLWRLARQPAAPAGR